MFDKANLLFEIGSEEIPAGYIPPALENIKKMMSDKLSTARIDFSVIEVYATPRRITAVLCGVSDTQRDEILELKGPSADRGYSEDGKPTPALLGFLKGNDVEEKDLEIQETPKGKYYFAKKKMKSGKTEEILPELLSSVIKELPFPKKMKWGTKQIGYPRPIRYILTLFNDKVLAFDVDGIVSSNLTRGHYVQSGSMIEIKKISEYKSKLKDAGVFLDQNERREMIKAELASAAKKAGGVLVDDEELVSIVTYLVEKPHAVVCEFNSDYLKIPDIVLITEMREHQKYFAVRSEDGKLTNKFLVVSNNPATSFVKDGNERVIRARFSDAEFFFNEDRKHKLESKIESLKTVLFHKELGSIYDKVERVRKTASVISKQLKLDAAVCSKIDRAVLLSKADLNTSMVMEFTSLQGKMGRIYALMDGEDQLVADAIEDHYRPRFQGDAVPSSIVSVVLSSAEKIDNIMGSYSVGNIPKGSQDPYALRRQANAVADLFIKNRLNADIALILDECASMYKDGKNLVSKVLEFFSARVNTIFADAGFAHDEIDACLSLGEYDYYDLFLRAGVLNKFRKAEDFSAMLLGFKRINNIYNSFRSKNENYTLDLNEKLFSADAEKNLHSFFVSKKDAIDSAIASKNYDAVFSVLTEAKSHIDKFFDDVMVMDKDTALRDNRLALLESIVLRFRGLIDFSKISD
ncbi:MAG TPA: glycine--tRNA ligase subunit beta [Spirochaetota bacterium]|nr:glycine--tRNA ligase subunit beta [Spirochaetota bacterium]HOR44347.1 glycine--tRNA ligase subunit beta [Spirochaetota bacterium]HPK55826.1 glycine--tRNA ligase subunit beta [Spirochaetota bacterium]